jgi:iduronate 2-sulfatase
VWADERPNVLFLIADDLTAEALACYGNQQCRTPNIDRLAAQGTRFTRAYCQFPVCGPSRAALMSGLYPQQLGMHDNRDSWQFTDRLGQRPSMAEHFCRHGYYTARVSKIYHMRVPGDITAGVDGPDHAASWTERFNCQAPEWMSEGEHEHLTNEKLHRDPEKHYGLGFGTAFYVVRGATDGAEQADTQAADKAIELLEAHRDEAFFLAVGFVRPHVPLVAPASDFAPYPAEDMRLPRRVPGDWDDIPRLGRSRNSREIGLAGRLDRQRAVLAAYYACVSFMDAQVGRVLDSVDRLGLRDETIIVFTSDHGYHLGEHDLWQKQSLHEESARIPLIVSAPGQQAAVCDSLAQQIDLYPTLAELAGLAIPRHCEGRSLAPLLAHPEQAVHEDVYCYRGNGHLLRTDRWALLAYDDGTHELYDMQRDPRQFANLAENPQYADTLSELQRRLETRVAAMTASAQ